MMKQQKCVPQSLMIIMLVCDQNIFIALLSNVPKGLIENEIAEIKDRFFTFTDSALLSHR